MLAISSQIRTSSKIQPNSKVKAPFHELIVVSQFLEIGNINPPRTAKIWCVIGYYYLIVHVPDRGL